MKLSEYIKAKYVFSGKRTGWFAFILMAGLTLLFTLWFPSTKFQYDNYLLAAGSQYYRILTAHFVHHNLFHLLFNLLGLLVIALLHSRHYKFWQWTLSVILLCIFISYGMHYVYPSQTNYVGFSAVLYGLIMIGAIADMLTGIKSGYLIFILVIAKVVYEQMHGGNETIEYLIQIPVAINAHLLGVVSGIFIGILLPFTLPRL